MVFQMRKMSDFSYNKGKIMFFKKNTSMFIKKYNSSTLFVKKKIYKTLIKIKKPGTVKLKITLFLPFKRANEIDEAAKKLGWTVDWIEVLLTRIQDVMKTAGGWVKWK